MERQRLKIRVAHGKRYAKILSLIRKQKERDLDEQKFPGYEQLYSYLKKFPRESGSAINQWVEAVERKNVVVGMPEALPIPSWGKPDKINRSRLCSDQ